METTFIKSAIGMMSCVGIGGEFPFKHGNYCSNTDNIYFVNLWAENIDHLITHNIIDDKLEALVFTEHGCKYALVVDKRIPSNVYHKPYFCGIRTSEKVIRHFYKIPDNDCICDHGHISWTSFSGQEKKGSCIACETKYTQRRIQRGVYRALVDIGEYNSYMFLQYQDGEFYQFGKAGPFDKDLIKGLVDETVSDVPSYNEQSNLMELKDFLNTPLTAVPKQL